MIDLFLNKLADCIQTAAGNIYHIQTDWRVWLGFSRIIATKDATLNQIQHIYTDKVPPEEQKECFELLMKFYQPECEFPRSTGERAGTEKVLDYFLDSQLIYASFMEQYKIDLLEKPDGVHYKQMHWHQFLALLSGLHNTKLNEVMSYRCWDGETKTEYGKQMSKLRKAWELPTEQDEKTQQDLDAFNSLFEK